ncbi:MAG TPA: lipoyl(octanoyl) transferase LipB [Chitinophagaceae bacterium]|nr:lipoyl(octanoyl) transferase LipB [Chitinophagaceae bacterium]
MQNRKIVFEDLGRKAYKDAWDYQENLLQQSVKSKSASEATSNFLLFVEHPPVYTLGKSGKKDHVLLSDSEMEDKGIEYFQINRGGDITFHGLGQIVGYPILDLENFETDIGKYLRNLEEVIILTLAEYGIKGERSKGETGVWIDAGVPGRERKICAMGVRCSRWITMHGFAFNVNTDLTYFDGIIPCGIQNKQVTSLQKELGKELDIEEVKEKLRKNFEKVFEATILTPVSYFIANGNEGTLFFAVGSFFLPMLPAMPRL